MMLRHALATVSVLLVVSPLDALANKVTRLTVTPINNYSKAPQFEVYSTDGERWTDVDMTDTSRVTVGLNARCRYEGRGNKAYKGELLVPGFIRVGTKEPANFLIPHSSQASAVFRWDGGTDTQFDPVQACNQELSKRAANTPGKTRLELLAEGFNVNYPAVLQARYSFRCDATGLGRSDLESRQVLINARVKCEPSALAADNLPEQKPVPPKPARLVQLLKAGTFAADPEVYTADCPATIRFNGTLTSNRSGSVKYRYTRYDGTRSPEFTLKFDAAETKNTRAWTTHYSKPKPSTTLSAGGNASSEDFQGWYRMEILSPKPTGQIVAKYRVMCGADSEPQPAGLQMTPLEEEPKVQLMELQKSEPVPATRQAEPARKRD